MIYATMLSLPAKSLASRGWTIKAYCDIGTAGAECEPFGFVVLQTANREMMEMMEMMIDDDEKSQR